MDALCDLWPEPQTVGASNPQCWPPPTTQLPSCVQGLAFTGLTYPHNIPMEATAQRDQGNCSGSPSCGRQG